MESPTYTREELEASTSRPYGHVYLLNCIAESTGLTETLDEVFPTHSRALLAIAQFCAMHTLPLSRVGYWAQKNEVDGLPENLNADRLMDIFREIKSADIEQFLNKWALRHSEDNYLAYDTTGFAEKNTSQLFQPVGTRRSLTTFNVLDLCLLFGRKSALPVSFSVYNGRPGNAKDLINFLEKYHKFNLKKLTIVMGEKYCTEENLNLLINGEDDPRFLIKVRQSTKGIFDSIKNRFDKDKEHDLSPKKDKFYWVDKIKWGEKKVFVHVLRNRLDKISANNVALYNLKDMQYHASLDPNLFADDDNYRNALSFFQSSSSPTGYNVEIRFGVVTDSALEVGWTILLSNYLRQADIALAMSEKWGIVERAFNNINDFSDLYNFPFSILQGSSRDVDPFLDCRVFTAFLSLIFLAYVDNMMFAKNLYGKLSMDELYEELAEIKLIRIKNERYVPDPGPKQKQILKAFSVPVPPARQ
jgi:hypothetical protein